MTRRAARRRSAELLLCVLLIAYRLLVYWYTRRCARASTSFSADRRSRRRRTENQMACQSSDRPTDAPRRLDARILHHISALTFGTAPPYPGLASGMRPAFPAISRYGHLPVKLVLMRVCLGPNPCCLIRKLLREILTRGKRSNEGDANLAIRLVPLPVIVPRSYVPIIEIETFP